MWWKESYVDVLVQYNVIGRTNSLTSNAASLCQPHVGILSTDGTMEAPSDLSLAVTLSGHLEDPAVHLHY